MKQLIPFVVAAVLNAGMPALANEVVFMTDAADPAYQAIQAQFVGPMLSQMATVAPSFAWARADIDGDAYDELFIKLTGTEFCSGGDCPVIGYRRVPEGSWPAILTTIAEKMAVDGKRVLTTRHGETTAWAWSESTLSLVPETQSASAASSSAPRP